MLLTFTQLHNDRTYVPTRLEIESTTFPVPIHGVVDELWLDGICARDTAAVPADLSRLHKRGAGHIFFGREHVHVEVTRETEFNEYSFFLDVFLSE